MGLNQENISFPSSGKYVDQLKQYIDNSTNNDIRIVRYGRSVDLIIGDKQASKPTSIFARIFEKTYDSAETAKILSELQAKLFDPNHHAKDKDVDHVVTALFVTINKTANGGNEQKEAIQKLTGFLIGKAVKNYKEQHGLVDIPELTTALKNEIVNPHEAKNLPQEIGRFAPYVTIDDESADAHLTVGKNGFQRCLDSLQRTTPEGKREVDTYQKNLNSQAIADQVRELNSELGKTANDPETILTQRLLSCMSGNASGLASKAPLSLLREAKDLVSSLDNPLATAGDIAWQYRITDKEVVVTILGSNGLRGEAEMELSQKYREKANSAALTDAEKTDWKETGYLARIDYKVTVRFSKVDPAKEPSVTITYSPPVFSQNCDPKIVNALQQSYKQVFLK